MSKHKKRQPLTAVQKFDNPIDLYMAFGMTREEAAEVVMAALIGESFLKDMEQANRTAANGNAAAQSAQRRPAVSDEP